MPKRTPEEIEAIFARYFNRSRRGVKKKRATARRGPIGIPPEEWRNIRYRRWVANRACCIPRCHTRISEASDLSRVDPAHTERGGQSQKGPDRSCVPLCRYHHNCYDGKIKIESGKVGQKAFEEYHEVDMKAMAAKYWRMFRDETNPTSRK